MWINHKDRSNSTVLVGFFNIYLGVSNMNISNIFVILTILCIVDSMYAINWFWESHKKESGPSLKMATFLTISNLFWSSGLLFLLATVAPSHTWIYWVCAIGWSIDLLAVKMYHFKHIYLGKRLGTMIIAP